MPSKRAQVEQLLKDAGILTPKNVARVQDAIKRSGPGQAAEALLRYRHALDAFKRGDVSAIAIAKAHDDFFNALELTGEQGQRVVTRAINLVRSLRGPKRRN